MIEEKVMMSENETRPAEAGTGPAADDYPAVRQPRHPGQWVAVVVIGLVVVQIAVSMVTNERFRWGIVFEWFHHERILHGLLNTLVLTVVSMLVGIVLGAVLAIMRESRNRVVAGLAWAYVWIFRGTPVFVQLLLWGSISALYPTIALSLPFLPPFLEFSANDVITPFIAAILGLGLNEAAYMAEIIRGGIRAVDPGQIEAARALGMGRASVLGRIVLPQAMRVIIPPTSNELIGMLKTSSMVAVLAYPDLLYSAQLIYTTNYQVIPLLLTASLWYLIVSSILSIGQYFVERRLSASDRRIARGGKTA
ncbi:amino acid ABC transporter permease [Propionicicella superfundia]|uniref:amino acid ABC transporter permease n=1 Tax=Propionicicella superfundia TaxID=348582 RepID=UPI000404DF59|nr:amino acid ABC transporter permease [Propionicicella superfundia]